MYHGGLGTRPYVFLFSYYTVIIRLSLYVGLLAPRPIFCMGYSIVFEADYYFSGFIPLPVPRFSQGNCQSDTPLPILPKSLYWKRRSFWDIGPKRESSQYVDVTHLLRQNRFDLLVRIPSSQFSLGYPYSRFRPEKGCDPFRPGSTMRLDKPPVALESRTQPKQSRRCIVLCNNTWKT